MTRGLYQLGRWCARHGRLVFALWLATLLLVAAADRLLPPPALEPFVLAGTDSASAQVLMNSAFPGTSSEAAPLVIHDPDLDLATGQGRELVTAVVRAVRATDGVSEVRNPLRHDDLMSDDHHTAIAQVTMAERAAGDSAAGQEVLDTATAAARDVSSSAVVALGGYIGQQISRTNTRPSEAIGLLIALVVLLLTLRRGWPVMVPLLNAVMAVGIGLNLIKLLGRMVYIPEEAPTLGTMLGLGVGIDYALFLVTRHRNLLTRGYPVDDAVGRTAGTAGAGMVFAGATLLAAVSGLALTGISFLAWLGYSAAVVVAVALAAALTLVPALLAMLGDRVLTKPQAAALRAGEIAEAGNDEHLDRGAWARIADVVTSRPWPFAIGATVLLLALAAPMLDMKFHQVDATALPDETTAHIAEDLIVAAFGAGATGPLAVVGELYAPAEAPEDDKGSGDPRTRDPRLVAITKTLRDTDGIDEVQSPIVSTDGGVVVWRLTPATGPSDPATEALVTELRTTTLPAATADRQMVAWVGGVTAARTDLTTRVAERLLPFIIGVATLSFLLLLLAYRSLVIPAKAAAMNLLSISAAYGVVVMVFQWGWGANLIGLDGPVPIESYVPMMMFAVLFGLSMDYEVFLLTAFTEHWERSRDIVVAIRRALADTGRVITSAALIMVGVFAAFVVLDNSVIKMFGIGLATAVAVDATIVRCILVPSLMVLAAAVTWWLPKWLDRILPRLHVEGDPTALESISTARPEQPADRHPGTPAWGMIVGVVAGWWLGSRLAADSAGTPAAGLPLALSAVAGGVLAWLPRRTAGAGATPAGRYIAFCAGALLSAVSFLLVGTLFAATARNPALQAGVAVLLPGAIVALTALRRWAIPMLAGIVTMAAAAVVVNAAPSTLGLAITIACPPALTALVVGRIIGALGRPRPRATTSVEADQPASGSPGDDQPEPARADTPAGVAR